MSARIAFLTPEFPTEWKTAGGLSNYLGRMTRTLVQLGHQPEVFTIAAGQANVIDYHGVRVERLEVDGWEATNLWARWNWRRVVFRNSAASMRMAQSLAEALQLREREAPFDLVQCSDYRLAGLYARRDRSRPLLARSSSATDLCRRINRLGRNPVHWRMTRLEAECLRRADRAYAPSRYVADYYRKRHGIAMHVVRPPFFLETEPAENLSFQLPDRYLLHFGNINRVKGSDVLATALRLVWRQAPDFTMVWAGTVPRRRHPCQVYPQLRSGRNRFVWLGALTKPEVYAVVRGAVATVAPSRCDNLPNSVIESLTLGVPVIGSRGASVDELVEHGESGALVPLGDAARLADAMLNAWRGRAPFDGKAFRLLPIFEEMNPRRAVENLLRLGGLEADSTSHQRKLQRSAVAV